MCIVIYCPDGHIQIERIKVRSFVVHFPAICFSFTALCMRSFDTFLVQQCPLAINKSSVRWVVKKKEFKLYPLQIPLVQWLKPPGYGTREDFARTLLANIDRDHAYLKIIFSISDETTFHVSGVVNRYNVRLWGTENRRVITRWTHRRWTYGVDYSMTWLSDLNFLMNPP